MLLPLQIQNKLLDQSFPRVAEGAEGYTACEKKRLVGIFLIFYPSLLPIPAMYYLPIPAMY
jgi:hypothetical protein